MRWRIRPFRVVELVAALLALAAAFGLDFTGEQQAAILGVVAVVFVGGEAAQRNTTPLARPRDKAGRPLRPARR